MARSPKQINLRRKGGRHLIGISGREIETRGLADGFWTDLYHRSMTVYWPTFFGTAAAIFVFLNTVFAFLYWLGNEPIANVAGNEPLGFFYFSVETLATVGYGDMHPQTHYGHFIATIEIFTGMSFLAVMTGLIFARFSRPRARFIFAKNPVVTIHQGQPTLMIRIANERNNAISQATARLWLLLLETTLEGVEYRRYHELLLDRREHPMFMLTWSIFHVIDETSPLYRMTPADLTAADAALTLNVSGVDDNSAQYLYARRLYSYQDIRWKYRYRDITSFSEQGTMVIDYSVFHEIIPEDDITPVPSADAELAEEN
ncbi:MAG TPA: ion channel [Xanthobacteraceae bacterium]|nr:ion channel [Xanthobacteraceae bacterium]